jgi:hypothetical protein
MLFAGLLKNGRIESLVFAGGAGGGGGGAAPAAAGKYCIHMCLNHLT